MNRKVSWVLEAKGDGYWGLENGDKVRCTKITSYTDIVYDGSKEITETFYKVYHRGLKCSAVYRYGHHKRVEEEAEKAETRLDRTRYAEFILYAYHRWGLVR